MQQKRDRLVKKTFFSIETITKKNIILLSNDPLKRILQLHWLSISGIVFFLFHATFFSPPLFKPREFVLWYLTALGISFIVLITLFLFFCSLFLRYKYCYWKGSIALLLNILLLLFLLFALFNIYTYGQYINLVLFYSTAFLRST